MNMTKCWENLTANLRKENRRRLFRKENERTIQAFSSDSTTPFHKIITMAKINVSHISSTMCSSPFELIRRRGQSCSSIEIEVEFSCSTIERRSSLLLVVTDSGGVMMISLANESSFELIKSIELITRFVFVKRFDDEFSSSSSSFDEIWRFVVGVAGISSLFVEVERRVRTKKWANVSCQPEDFAYNRHAVGWPMKKCIN